jgi:hypothetical protein
MCNFIGGKMSDGITGQFNDCAAMQNKPFVDPSVVYANAVLDGEKEVTVTTLGGQKATYRIGQEYNYGPEHNYDQ